MATIDRRLWIAATTAGFHLYMDHNYLVIIFDPLSVVSSLTQTAIRKVLR